MTDWFSPRAVPNLPENAVHVWRASLDLDRETQAKCAGRLSDDERARAARFVLEHDRNSYVAAHGILRSLLAGYVECRPEEVQFSYGAYGKPSVSYPRLTDPLSFNLSHSHGLGAVAIVRGREIGVDVEKIRPDFASVEVAERYFSSAEVDELRQLPDDRRAEGFFLCWTRKEAYIKALGEGLRIPLNTFSVSLTPGEPAQLRALGGDRWSIRSFERPTSSEVTHVGAVVCEGNNWTAQYLDWDGFWGR
jgi:4'-phosphopantetheinyl transferase